MNASRSSGGIGVGSSFSHVSMSSKPAASSRTRVSSAVANVFPPPNV